jgi:hypothetical protein
MRTGSQHYIVAAQAGHLRKPQASLNRDEQEDVVSAASPGIAIRRS